MKKIKLDLGEPAYPLPEFVQRELCKYLGKMHKFPQNYKQVEEKIGEWLGIKKELVSLTSGATAGIDTASRAFGEKTLVFTPTFIEFAAATDRNNCELKKVNALKGKKYEVKGNISELEKATLTYLANPNNPFGFTEQKTIEKMLKATNGVLAVDETYWWFKGESIAPLVEEFDNLMVIGSFSKTFSLAGMRAGYIIASKKLLKKMHNKLLHFRLSALSAQAVLICLKNKEFFKKRLQKTIKKRKKFERWLQKKGFNLYITHNNNAVIKFPEEKKATAFTQHLEKNNIIVLQGNGKSLIGLTDSFVRIAIGTEKEMEHLKKAIDGFLA